MRVDDFRVFHVFFELFHVAFELGATVLEPCYHLGVGEAQAGGDFVAVGRAEILLIEETLFELEDLMIGERRARFSFFLRLLAVVEEVEVTLTI